MISSSLLDFWLEGISFAIILGLGIIGCYWTRKLFRRQTQKSQKRKGK